MQLISHPTILIFFCLFTQAQCSEEHFNSQEAYGYGVLTSVGLGVMSFIMTAILLSLNHKLGGTKKIEPLIQWLMALAVGCLLGDAFIHLIPHSILDHEDHDDHTILEDDEHDEDEFHEEEIDKFNMSIYSFFILLGIFLFFVIESIAHKYTTKPEGAAVEDVEVQKLETIQNGKQVEKTNSEERQLQNEIQDVNQIQLTEGKFCNWKGKETWGYLNLLVDLVCNVVDGLAIGMIFRAADSKLLITSTVIAIYVHEIPQEIADAGILLKAKFLPSQVLFANSFCNITAVIGCILGVGIADNISEVGHRYLIGFIVGIFIYMSGSVLVPLMQKEKTTKIKICQFFGFVAGVAIMYGVGELEE